jgi:hypothetical protein
MDISNFYVIWVRNIYFCFYYFWIKCYYVTSEGKGVACPPGKFLCIFLVTFIFEKFSIFFCLYFNQDPTLENPKNLWKNKSWNISWFLSRSPHNSFRKPMFFFCILKTIHSLSSVMKSKIYKIYIISNPIGIFFYSFMV